MTSAIQAAAQEKAVRPTRELSLRDSNVLINLANALDNAERMGVQPGEPAGHEGAVYVRLSDVLARQISKDLRRIALP